MKNKIPLLFALGLLAINLLSNSCKKDKQSSIQTLFTNGTWRLASVNMRVTIGDTVKLDTNLNTTCDTSQIFTFNANNTCSYTNFDCVHQPTATGNWALSPDQLYLYANMVCKDTIKSGTGSSKPFALAQIYNIGQYSLVLQTGDLQNYSATKRRTIMRYGFIREKATVK